MPPGRFDDEIDVPFPDAGGYGGPPGPARGEYGGPPPQEPPTTGNIYRASGARPGAGAGGGPGGVYGAPRNAPPDPRDRPRDPDLYDDRPRGR